MSSIEQEDGRWQKVPERQWSEIHKLMRVEPADEGAVCLICQAPATAKALFHSWRPSDAEPIVGTMQVCRAHDGEWTWYPRNPLVVFDGESQRIN